MALVKETLRKSIYDGILKILSDQAKKASEGDEKESPEEIVKEISTKMASVISDAVESYIKSGDIFIGPNNISVTSSAPGSPSVVVPLQPAKIV